MSDLLDKVRRARGGEVPVKMARGGTQPGTPARREHIARRDCWCEPEEIEDGVLVHRYEQ